MRKTTAAASMAAALTLGGAAGAVLFTPAVSGAQTGDAPDATEQPCEAPFGARHHGMGLRGGAPEAVADLLGLSPEEIRDRLADGQSLADIAAEVGVETQDLVDTIVAERLERLDAAVEAGRITEADAAERAEDVVERVTDMIDNVPVLDGDGPHSRARGGGYGSGTGYGMSRGPGHGMGRS